MGERSATGVPWGTAVGRLEGLHLEEDHEKKYGKGSALNMKEP